MIVEKFGVYCKADRIKDCLKYYRLKAYIKYDDISYELLFFPTCKEQNKIEKINNSTIIKNIIVETKYIYTKDLKLFNGTDLYDLCSRYSSKNNIDFDEVEKMVLKEIDNLIKVYFQPYFDEFLKKHCVSLEQYESASKD